MHSRDDADPGRAGHWCRIDLTGAGATAGLTSSTVDANRRCRGSDRNRRYTTFHVDGLEKVGAGGDFKVMGMAHPFP